MSPGAGSTTEYLWSQGRGDMRQDRRRAEVAQKRLRGHRIKFGVGELSNLDAAPPPQRMRVETDALPPAPSPLSSSESSSGDEGDTNGVYPTVFGDGWSEWRHVKEVLFSTTASPQSKSSALDVLRQWHARERKHRRLPPYVEATELLMEAVLLDENNVLSSVSLERFYGAVIARAVHVMTGSFAAGEANTYRKRAREIGFPEEAVEVRQRVAHGALPCLSEVRWVCGLVLHYLFAEYWMVQEAQVKLMLKEAGVASGHHKRSTSQRDTTPVHTTVEEMRALLDVLSNSEDEEEEEVRPSATLPSGSTGGGTGEKAGSSDVMTVSGWQLI